MQGEEPAIDFGAIERVVHHLPGFVYVLRKEADGRVAFTYLSRAIERLLGVPARDGMDDASRVFERVHPEDLALVEASIENAERASAWRAEFRMRDGDSAQALMQAADQAMYAAKAGGGGAVGLAS